MPRKLGVAVIAVGAVLILSALFLLLHNRYENARAGQQAEDALASVEAAIAGQPTETTAQIATEETQTVPTQPPLDPEMPTVVLNGYAYVGYLELPTLELKLPVMSKWDYTRLQIAPCRQFGSSRTDDLVIAAHNYRNHFGRLKVLAVGDSVTFTDMDGIVSTYRVEKVETLQPTEVAAVQNSGHDLVLYTCTKGGKTRVTVSCDRAEEKE